MEAFQWTYCCTGSSVLAVYGLHLEEQVRLDHGHDLVEL